MLPIKFNYKVAFPLFFIATYLLLYFLFNQEENKIRFLFSPKKEQSLIAEEVKALEPSLTPSPTPTLIPSPTPSPNIRPLPTSTPTVTKAPPPPPVTNNIPPSSGYSRQSVQTDMGVFQVDIVSADLNSTRVIVDTASESDCTDNCPVLSLGEYVARNGAYAGINGSYFCPATYPTCAGKTNSFDTLLMNKNKRYFNSDNNVYSVVPAVIFSGGSARFVRQSLEWGRDTSVDSVLANYPLLLSGGQVVFGESGDGKHTGKGLRNFVGSKDSTVYIGIVRNATLSEATKVLQTMGLHNALNLDSGGSSALWSGGYKVGPGRNVPNALLFVQK